MFNKLFLRPLFKIFAGGSVNLKSKLLETVNWGLPLWNCYCRYWTL